ncbi:unnamed protein product [Heligmosomoides polygyrus]|uniref:Uncharacterized protein n=1 Tax=Heligmosomoides polygyrus TaxID=6339 RepID=A0A183FYY6_HELPZ|nr:unnamed protein product [Heligmosomoides polygyrus]
MCFFTKKNDYEATLETILKKLDAIHNDVNADDSSSSSSSSLGSLQPARAVHCARTPVNEGTSANTGPHKDAVPPFNLATATCQVSSETLVIKALAFEPWNVDVQIAKAAYLESVHRTDSDRGSSSLYSKDTTSPSGKIIPQRKQQADTGPTP